MTTTTRNDFQNLKERPVIPLTDKFTTPQKIVISLPERSVFEVNNNNWERYSEVDKLYKILPSSGLEFDYEKLYPSTIKISQTAPADLRLVMEELIGKKALTKKEQIQTSNSSSFSTPSSSRKISRSVVISQTASAPEEENKLLSHRHSTVHSSSPLRKNSSDSNADEIQTRMRTTSFAGITREREQHTVVHPLLENVDDTVLMKAVNLFKEKPTEGVKYLISEKVIENEANQIGTFLFVYDKFDKVQLGEYLSRGVDAKNVDDFATKILDNYVSYFTFEHMDFDLALRFFLYRFRLPGEAQKIDRLMKIFAAKYFEVHKDDNIFKNELYVYAIAFGTIMLNTDLYNEHVKYKMTLKQFIDNIQYFNTNGPPATDIPVEFLEDLYFKIEIDEIKMEKERSLFPNALKRCWVFVYAKTGMGSNRWKRRWIVLSDNSLFMFRKYDDDRLVYKIALAGASISVVGKEKGRQFCLWLHLPPQNITTKWSNSTLTQKSPYQNHIDNDQKAHILLSANNSVEISLWSRAIEHCIVNSSK